MIAGGFLVMPVRFLSRTITFSLLSESNPVVGSSKRRIFGREINSTAIDVLLTCPPDNFQILVFASWDKSRDSRQSLTMSSWSLIDFKWALFIFDANMSVSFTENWMNKWSCWGTNPILISSFSLMPFTSKLPKVLKLTWPWRPVSCNLLLIQLRRVVLPAPEGPMRALMLPAMIWPFMLFKTCFFLNVFWLQGMTFDLIDSTV